MFKPDRLARGNRARSKPLVFALAAWAFLLLGASGAGALDDAPTAGEPAETRASDRIAAGDRAMRTGDFEEASNHYRDAVLDNPQNGRYRLRFATALFALGRYSYASFSLRRAVAALGYADDLWEPVADRFATRAAYERLRRDLDVYLRYYPNDPHGTSVRAFVAFMDGDTTTARRDCKTLLARNDRDDFAQYLLRRVELLQTPPWRERARGAVVAERVEEDRGEAHGTPPHTRDAARNESAASVAAVKPNAGDNPAATPRDVTAIGRPSPPLDALSQPETRGVLAR